MIVAPEHYKLFASILNDFGRSRTTFSYEEFAQASESLGFKRGRNGTLIPPRRIGKGLFWYLKTGIPIHRNVSPKEQDAWKLELFKLYGWTEDTFRPCSTQPRVCVPDHGEVESVE